MGESCTVDANEEINHLLVLGQSLLWSQGQRMLDQRHVDPCGHRCPPGRTGLRWTNIFAIDLCQCFFVHGFDHFPTALTTFSAASAIESPLVIGNPDSFKIFFPNSTLLPSRRTTSGKLR